MELCIDRLTKQYENKIAVDRVSLQLTNGVYGLLGANGAGKTTFMRMLCGILKPTGGTVTFDGLDVSSEEYRAELGYLPQDFGYYPDFSGWDFLMYMASLKGLTKLEAKRKAKELLELVSLSDVGKKKIATYSGGMKQRLGIAQALLNDPKIIILDEPTAGLDPKERVRFRNLIKDLGKDSIVLLSTHIVSDVEHIADTVLMMKAGQIIYNGSADEIENLEEFYLAEFEGRVGLSSAGLRVLSRFQRLGFFDVYGITKRIDKIRSKKESKRASGISEPFRCGQKENCNLFRRHEAKAWHCAGTTK